MAGGFTFKNVHDELNDTVWEISTHIEGELKPIGRTVKNSYRGGFDCTLSLTYNFDAKEDAETWHVFGTRGDAAYDVLKKFEEQQ